jgi:hypothetical protein
MLLVVPNKTHAKLIANCSRAVSRCFGDVPDANAATRPDEGIIALLLSLITMNHFRNEKSLFVDFINDRLF